MTDDARMLRCFYVWLTATITGMDTSKAYKFADLLHSVNAYCDIKIKGCEPELGSGF